MAADPAEADHGEDGGRARGRHVGARGGRPRVVGTTATRSAWPRPSPARGTSDSPSRSSARTARPVTAYDEQHERDLHLIVVRRDLTGYQHVHPRLDAGHRSMDHPGRPPPGCLAAAGRLLAVGRRADGAGRGPAGARRLHAGAAWRRPPDGRTSTATTSRSPARSRPARRPSSPRRSAATGSRSPTCSPTSAPTDTWSSLRDADLGYLHVHPEDDAGPGPEIAFGTEFTAPAGIGSSSTSGTAARSTPRRSRCRSTEHRVVALTTDRCATAPALSATWRASKDRAGHHGHDLRLVRQPHRAQAQQARRRHGQRQLRHRARPGHPPGDGHHRRAARDRRGRRVRRRACRRPPRRPTTTSGTPSSSCSASGCWSRALLTVPVVLMAMVPALQVDGWQWAVAHPGGARRRVGRVAVPPGRAG